MGEFDKKITVEEDPAIWERGHEKDPVVIEVPEGQTVDDEHPLQFVCACGSTRSAGLDNEIRCHRKVGTVQSNFAWYSFTPHELAMSSPTRPAYS